MLTENVIKLALPVQAVSDSPEGIVVLNNILALGIDAALKEFLRLNGLLPDFTGYTRLNVGHP